jgi:signal transduction histidine kinase/FixJ family two-component response regulator
MNFHARQSQATLRDFARLMYRRGLFRKYVTLFVIIVCVALIVNGSLGIWLFYQEQKQSLIRLQRQQAELAAVKISQFIKEIESQLGWTIQLPWSADMLDEIRYDALRLFRQVPAIRELAQLDAAGREQLRLSRTAPDVVHSQEDFSEDLRFIEALANKVYYGPVYFRESEPYMILAMADTRRDAGVTIVEINLKLIRDIVSQIDVGKHGQVYVIDERARIIAHRDMSLVLRNTDVSQLTQVKFARDGFDTSMLQATDGEDILGHPVLAAYAQVALLGWLVFVELPKSEAYAPLNRSILLSIILLMAGFLVATMSGLLLARRMIDPIQKLRIGAMRIGGGDLGHRISIKSNDELEALGEQFNSMAGQLEESYATLERKVAERTHDLEYANAAKSRFLAMASHDLRQPLHALGLFVAHLRMPLKPRERAKTVERVDAAVGEMTEMFNSLLDISKLDAGVLVPKIVEFSIARLLQKIETAFDQTAREKGLRLRVVRSDAWVRSDALLLERILLNLVSNAMRYTLRGGVIVGCRRRGEMLRIEVWDSGPGIPEDHRQNIFGEFFQLPTAERDRYGGLGLGLAIVDRLRRLFNHEIELTSTVGRGSRFAILVPMAADRLTSVETVRSPHPAAFAVEGKLILIIDDAPIVLEGTSRLLGKWGYSVVTADSDEAALIQLAEREQHPDLIISDYHLANGKTGIEAIERIDAAFGASIPTILISGDTAPERLRDARDKGYILLHKPVDPMRLRAVMHQLFKDHERLRPGVEETHPMTQISSTIPSQSA